MLSSNQTKKKEKNFPDSLEHRVILTEHIMHKRKSVANITEDQPI